MSQGVDGLGPSNESRPKVVFFQLATSRHNKYKLINKVPGTKMGFVI